MMTISIFTWMLLAGLVGLIEWIASHSGSNPYTDMSPLEIAEERYTLGEIDDDTYEQIRADLELA